jgi:hemin uptake protein HemP
MSFLDPRPQNSVPLAEQPAAPRPLPDHDIPVHDAMSLTAGGVRAQIALAGQIYTLRITRAGGLILTK